MNQARHGPWAIVLAGGEGTRLRSLTRLIHGDDRPKQYACIAHRSSMLERTLARMAWLVPPERTIVVTQRHHDVFLRAVPLDPGIRILAQPGDRGTAAAALWPAELIAERAADAPVILVPSDHYVGDDQGLVRHLQQLAHDPPDGQVVLMGAQPTEPETDYGWIETGGASHRDRDGLLQVRSFAEKPSPVEAVRYLARGDLWNTLICVGTARSMVDMIRRALPDLGAALAPLARMADDRISGPEAAYAAVGPSDLSRDVLQTASDRLLVSRLPAIGWSDWGTPERVLATVGTKAKDLAPLEARPRTHDADPRRPLCRTPVPVAVSTAANR